MRYLQRLPPVLRVERESLLISLTKGKIALHVGCVDSGLLDDRLFSGRFLHSELAQSARELWGLDSDGGGIEKLRGLGFSRLLVGSAESPPAEIPRGYFDVVVAGELIEHLRNPGAFLDSTLSLLGPGGLLVITTPNALRFYNPLTALSARELVHPDHLCWYSPYTLLRTVQAGKFKVTQVYVYAQAPLASLRKSSVLEWPWRLIFNGCSWVVHNLAVRLFPYSADGLIVVATPTTGS